MPYIYVIVGDGVSIKVGISVRPKRRLRELQTGSSIELRLFAAINVPDRELAERIERKVHRILRRRHLSGEWYFMPPEQAVELIAGLAAKHMRSGAGTEVEFRDTILASRAHPATQVVCECGHRAVLRLSKAEILRKRFKCKSCGRSIDGRRFFIRRVA